MDSIRIRKPYEIWGYELKPFLAVAIGVFLLLETPWSGWSFPAGFLCLAYGFAIVSLRHRFRGSFRDWFSYQHH